MLDGKYNVNLNTPIGPIDGTISLNANGNNVQGIIEIMGMKSKFYGVKIANDKCEFNGNLDTPLGKFNYDATCTVFNDNLELTAKTPQGNLKINGKRIK